MTKPVMMNLSLFPRSALNTRSISLRLRDLITDPVISPKKGIYFHLSFLQTH